MSEFKNIFWAYVSDDFKRNTYIFFSDQIFSEKIINKFSTIFFVDIFLNFLFASINPPWEHLGTKQNSREALQKLVAGLGRHPQVDHSTEWCRLHENSSKGAWYRDKPESVKTSSRTRYSFGTLHQILTLVRTNLTRVTSPLISSRSGSRLIFSVPFSYFLLIFYLPRFTPRLDKSQLKIFFKSKIIICCKFDPNMHPCTK